jgi:hypothetical protein
MYIGTRKCTLVQENVHRYKKMYIGTRICMGSRKYVWVQENTTGYKKMHMIARKYPRVCRYMKMCLGAR